MSAKVTWHSDKIVGQLVDEAFRGLVDAGEFLLAEANRTAPIEEGTLIGSGTVTSVPAKNQVLVSYDTPYAVRQHENTTLHHDSGRRAKWLERTFAENAQRVPDFIADRAKRVL